MQVRQDFCGKMWQTHTRAHTRTKQFMINNNLQGEFCKFENVMEICDFGFMIHNRDNNMSRFCVFLVSIPLVQNQSFKTTAYPLQVLLE